MQTSKPWYLSKSVWFNIASLLVAIGGVLIGGTIVTNPVVVAVAGATVAVGNVILRMTTTQAITGTPAANKQANAAAQDTTGTN